MRGEERNPGVLGPIGLEYEVQEAKLRLCLITKGSGAELGNVSGAELGNMKSSVALSGCLSVWFPGTGSHCVAPTGPELTEGPASVSQGWY